MTAAVLRRKVPDLGAECSLRQAQGETRPCHQHHRDVKLQSAHPVRRKDWEGSPGEGKPEVGVEPPPPEAQVVGHGNGRSEDNKGQQPHGDRRSGYRAQHHRDPQGERRNNRQVPGRNPGLQGTAVELVQGRGTLSLPPGRRPKGCRAACRRESRERWRPRSQRSSGAIGCTGHEAG